jgi:hypothetical protein
LRQEQANGERSHSMALGRAWTLFGSTRSENLKPKKCLPQVPQNSKRRVPRFVRRLFEDKNL